MTYEEYKKEIAPFEDIKERAKKITNESIKITFIRCYTDGVNAVGRKILIDNNIKPHKSINCPDRPISFEPVSARIDKNNNVIIIGWLYKKRSDYPVKGKEYKLNHLFDDIK